MHAVEVRIEDVDEARAELALAECESAKRAARLAEECAEEAEALSRESVDLASEWAKAARQFASLALGHSVRAIKMAPPLSPVTREAKKQADLAASFAHAAESCVRRD